MKATTKEFREFLLTQNAFALAIGVVIGAAIGRVIGGIVEDVLMPVVGLALPGGEWRNAQLTLAGQNAIKYGDLAGRIIDFLIVALVVFALTKVFLDKPAAPAATKSCPECLEAIPTGARKCRACGSAVA